MSEQILTAARDYGMALLAVDAAGDCEKPRLERAKERLLALVAPSPSVHRQASAGQEGVTNLALEALEAAHNGLKWYRERCPDAADGSDDEADGLIERALSALSTAAPESKAPSREVLFSEECFAPVHEGTVIDDWLIPLDTDLPKLEPGFSWQRVTRVIYRAAAPTAGETL